MYKPKSCNKCPMLANQNELYFCRIGVFYDKKTVLKRNVHKDCKLQEEPKAIVKSEITVEQATENLYNIYLEATQGGKK